MLGRTFIIAALCILEFEGLVHSTKITGHWKKIDNEKCDKIFNNLISQPVENPFKTDTVICLKKDLLDDSKYLAVTLKDPLVGDYEVSESGVIKAKDQLSKRIDITDLKPIGGHSQANLQDFQNIWPIVSNLINKL